MSFSKIYRRRIGGKKLWLSLFPLSIKKEAVRQLILNENIRLDGRNNHQIRPGQDCEVDYLHYAHGSSIFTRGETQSLTTVTLGSLLDANRIDSVITPAMKIFLL